MSKFVDENSRSKWKAGVHRMRKKIMLVFATIIMLILGSMTVSAASQRVSLNGKTYLIESYMASTGKFVTRISQKKSSGWSKKAQVSGVSLTYAAKYKNTLYFNGYSAGKDSLWVYKDGSTKISKKTNSIRIEQASGKYAVAVNEEYRDDYSVNKICIYNLATGQKKIISNNSVGEKIISGKVYYTKASGNQLTVMRCNLDGSSPQILANIKYNVDDIYEVELYSKYCKVTSWESDVKKTFYYTTPAASIKLNKTSLILNLKGTKTATLKATVTGASNKVTWSSSNKSIATVSSSGKVTAKKAGTVTIKAKANGKTATCKVTVKKS